MAAPFAGLLALAALLVQPAFAVEEVEAALDWDEECSAGNQSECALNALQRHIAKLREAAMPNERPVLDLELYRAMRKKDMKYDYANVDLATIGGIMNYLQTDVIPEHVNDYAGYQPKIGMSERYNGVDTIVAVKTKVKNPDSVVNVVGNLIDFALSALFISGEATGPAYNWNFGDIVGCQKIDDPRWPVEDPHYRFSLSGFCPNLKWEAKKAGAIAAIKKHKHDEDGEAPAETGRRRRRSPIECMTYSNQYHQPFGEVLRGGLCPNGTAPGKVPTGSPGCVYTYTPPTPADTVSLDDVVGITKLECKGGRLCKDWKDWRRHCADKKYHRKFNYKSRRRYSTILRSKACVEYDIHKACAKSCSSKECQKVPPSKRELGLPFWKGRCSAHMNAMRVERLAVHLGLATAGKTHQLLKETTPKGTCLSGNKSEICKPIANMGGPYCTRLWGGVCQTCYIPGANKTYEDLNEIQQPMCPWNIFDATTDYAADAAKPKCASANPGDLCCLYTGTCNKTLTAEPLPITEDGFAVVSSKQNTTAMVEYLQRAASVAYGAEIGPSQLAKLKKIAYWQWNLAPIKGKTLKSVMAMVKHYFA